MLNTQVQRSFVVFTGSQRKRQRRDIEGTVGRRWWSGYCVVTSCSDFLGYQRFGGSCCVHLQGRSSSEPLVTIWSTVQLQDETSRPSEPHRLYEGVSKSFRTEAITKWITINNSWEATQKVMTAKLTRLIHKKRIQLYPVAESCTVCSSRYRRPVWKFSDTPS